MDELISHFLLFVGEHRVMRCEVDFNAFTASVIRISRRNALLWRRGWNVRVLRVDPITAELWDGPSSAAGAAFEFVKAQLAGEKPNLDENRKVTVAMRR
jgi:hypothetical protein